MGQRTGALLKPSSRDVSRGLGQPHWSHAHTRGAGVGGQGSTQLSGSCSPSPAHRRLTRHPQAVPELSDTGHVGGHAAVGAGIGELGTVDLQALPIPGQGPARSSQELLMPLVPGNVWREAGSRALRSDAAAPLTKGTQGKAQGHMSKSQGKGPTHREQAAPRPGTPGTPCHSPGQPGPLRWVRCSEALQPSTHSHCLCVAQASCSHTVRCRGARLGSAGALGTHRVLGEQRPGLNPRSGRGLHHHTESLLLPKLASKFVAPWHEIFILPRAGGSLLPAWFLTWHLQHHILRC